MNRSYRKLLILLLIGAAWLLAPQLAYADNCSSLNDCYYTLRAALAAAVGLGVFAALMAIGLDIGPLSRSLKRKFKDGMGVEGAVGAGPDVWDRSLGVVSVAGMVADQPRTPGAQQQASMQRDASRAETSGGERQAAPPGEGAKPGSEQEARLPDQVQPPAETPTKDVRMRQAASDQISPGETGRTAPAQPRGDRTADQLRGESGAEQQQAGRSGEWSGETGAGEPGGADTGDVVDRAQEVADAFDAPDSEGMVQDSKPEGMAQTGKPDSAAQDAPAQSEPPREASAQEMPSQETTPRDPAQQSAKPASAQSSPPTEARTAGAAEAGIDSGLARHAGASASPPNADVARTVLGIYSDLAAVPGAGVLLRQAALSGRWAIHGSAAELGIARAISRQAAAPARVGDVVEGRPGADIVMVEDGAVIQVKNYYWNGPAFWQEEDVASATRRLVRQVELLRRRYAGREVQVAFSDLRRTPRQMGLVLQSIGVSLVRLAAATPPRPEDVVDAAFVERLRGKTAEDYWRSAIAAGWDEADTAFVARVQAAFQRDAGSAWLAFAVCAFDAESIYDTNPLGESYAALLQLLSRHSQGAFEPANIVERIAGDALQVAFESGGQQYVSRVSAQSDWFDFRVLHAVNAAIAGGGERRRFVSLPSPDQIAYLAFIDDETKRSLQEAGLVPALWPMDRQI